MKSLLVALTLLVPSLSFASPEPEPDPAQQARFEKQRRTSRAIELANALDLQPAAAIQLESALAKFDERRKTILEQLRSSEHSLRQIADGQASTGQVDQLVQSIIEARIQLEQLDREMIASVAKGFTAEQRARFALIALRPAMLPPLGGHRGPGAPPPPPLDSAP